MGIHRGFPPLSQDDVRIAAPGRVSVVANPLARLNGGHERLMGAPPPGASARMFRFHEHVLDGGAILGKGTIFSFDHGAIGVRGGFTHILVAGSTWESMIGAAHREYCFSADVTPGLVGDLACFLTLYTGGTAVDIRITNLDTGTSSTHITTPALTPAWEGAITGIPMNAGETNRFDVEIRGTLGHQLHVLGFCLYEDTSNHPVSAGTATYSSL